MAKLSISGSFKFSKKVNFDAAGNPIGDEEKNINEVKEALNEKNINRIMLDNFSPKMCFEAVKIINGAKEIEVSGGITEDNIREYALSGVDFISVGALTHSSKNLDLNFKADF